MGFHLISSPKFETKRLNICQIKFPFPESMLVLFATLLHAIDYAGASTIKSSEFSQSLYPLRQNPPPTEAQKSEFLMPSEAFRFFMDCRDQDPVFCQSVETVLELAGRRIAKLILFREPVTVSVSFVKGSGVLSPIVGKTSGLPFRTKFLT